MPPERRSENSRGAFVDTAVVRVRAGRGGRGAATFRREPFVPRGGPDGGDGGRGGSVILFATHQVATLVAYASRRVWRAGDGKPGQGGLKTGKAGADLRLGVPVGTVVVDAVTGAAQGDLDREGAETVVAAGGAGGRGNVHFKSSVKQAPHFAEPGEAGEERELRLELKLIADAGLVGAPNAGKSSLLRAISSATPKVAPYPFTTVDPQLGVAQPAGGEPLVFADIPGLIEGAARGAGLGLRFLRHVERTRVLVYVVDGAAQDPFGDLESVRREVAEYSPQLADRPSIVAVNKVDLPEVQELRRRVGGGGRYWISALTGAGLPELVEAVAVAVAEAPGPAPVEPEAAVVRLRPRRQAVAAPIVERRSWGFEVSGPAVTRLVGRTDFESETSLAYFQVQLDRLGVSAALEEAGAQPGDTVRIGDLEFEYQPG